MFHLLEVLQNQLLGLQSLLRAQVASKDFLVPHSPLTVQEFRKQEWRGKKLTLALGELGYPAQPMQTHALGLWFLPPSHCRLDSKTCVLVNAGIADNTGDNSTPKRDRTELGC